jgi:hypothetical protein
VNNGRKERETADAVSAGRPPPYRHRPPAKLPVWSAAAGPARSEPSAALVTACVGVVEAHGHANVGARRCGEAGRQCEVKGGVGGSDGDVNGAPGGRAGSQVPAHCESYARVSLCPAASEDAPRRVGSLKRRWLWAPGAQALVLACRHCLLSHGLHRGV